MEDCTMQPIKLRAIKKVKKDGLVFPSDLSTDDKSITITDTSSERDDNMTTYPRPTNIAADADADLSTRISYYLENTLVQYKGNSVVPKRDTVLAICLGHDRDIDIAITEKELDMTMNLVNTISHGNVIVDPDVNYGNIKAERNRLLTEWTDHHSEESALKEVNALLTEKHYAPITIDVLKNALWGKYGMLQTNKPKSSYKTVTLTKLPDDARYFSGDDGYIYVRGLILNHQSKPELDDTMSEFKVKYRLAKWAVSIVCSLPRYERVKVEQCKTEEQLLQGLYESMTDEIALDIFNKHCEGVDHIGEGASENLRMNGHFDW
jgi:hypothetical protein